MNLLPLLLPLVACTSNKDTGDDIVLIDLAGTLVDAATDAPVDDGWVLVDDGVTLSTARTGADGTWSVPGLDTSVPVDMTIAASGYTAYTFTGIDLSLASNPSTVHMYPRASTETGETLEISGTLTGAPTGSYALFYGETAYLNSLSVDADPYPWSFTATLAPESETYGLSIIDIDLSYHLNGIVYTTLAAGDAPDLALVTDLSEVTVQANRPTLDGVPAEDPDPTTCLGYGGITPNPSSYLTTGFNETCAADGDTFTYPVRALLTGTDWASAYVADETGETYSYGVQPVADPAQPVVFDLLDASTVGSHDDFVPGATLTFTPVDGASQISFYLYDRAGLAWMLVAYDAPEVSWPRLPDGFDTNLLFDTAANWYVAAETYGLDEEGRFDLTQPYYSSVTYGGEVRGD